MEDEALKHLEAIGVTASPCECLEKNIACVYRLKDSVCASRFLQFPAKQYCQGKIDGNKPLVVMPDEVRVKMSALREGTPQN